jgi:hypothetical protein
LTALNTSKSAYASFKLIGNKFFSKYQFKPPRSGTQAKDKFYCKIYNKVSVLLGWALLHCLIFPRHCCLCSRDVFSILPGRETLQSKGVMSLLKMEKARRKAVSSSRSFADMVRYPAKSCKQRINLYRRDQDLPFDF